MAVAYVEGGRAVWTVTAGEAAPGVPVTEHTPFHLGDVSEMLTAYAVVDLAERGRLRLDADVRAVVPWLPDLDGTVTPDHLLTQTAGYRDVRTVFDLQGRYTYDLDEDRPVDPVTTQAELETILRRQAASAFAPGDTVRQTPTHYAAAVALVEAATGRPFGGWMADDVFAPLGMDDAAVRAPGAPAVQAAVPYTRDEGQIVPAPEPDPWYGGQNAYASLADLVRWIGHLRPEGRDLAARLASPDALVLDMTGTDGDRTATWTVGRGVRTVEVDGAVRVYATDVGLSHLAFVLYEPDRDVGLVVLSNAPDFPLGVSAEPVRLGSTLWALTERALGADRFDVVPTITIDLAPPPAAAAAVHTDRARRHPRRPGPLPRHLRERRAGAHLLRRRGRLGRGGSGPAGGLPDVDLRPGRRAPHVPGRPPGPRDRVRGGRRRGPGRVLGRGPGGEVLVPPHGGRPGGVGPPHGEGGVVVPGGPPRPLPGADRGDGPPAATPFVTTPLAYAPSGPPRPALSASGARRAGRRR